MTFEQGPVEVNIHSNLLETVASVLSKAQDVKTAEEFTALTEQTQSEFLRNSQQNWTRMNNNEYFIGQTLICYFLDSSATSTDTSAAPILNDKDS